MMVKRHSFGLLRKIVRDHSPKPDEFEAAFTMQDLLATVILCAILGIILLYFGAPMSTAMPIGLI